MSQMIGKSYETLTN